MNTYNFSFANKIIASTVFAIALTTFSLTVEPTASFWDAGEYISTSAKLQIGHPRVHHLSNDGCFFRCCEWERKYCIDD